ncbi:MAG: hypothetical protein JWR26_2704 [Pedosphaera sp.]|nr:hypothetical protein [Pedosphaera sp.]
MVLNFFVAALLLGIIPLLASCAGNQPDASLQPMKTSALSSSGHSLRNQGFLVIYTPTNMRFGESNARYFPHTPYEIYNHNSDWMYEYVPNHLGKKDEKPTLVTIPSGPYRVKAHTAYGHLITIPVVIRPETLTTICLEGDRKPPAHSNGDLYSLHLNGKTVGWVADSPEPFPSK